MAVPESIQPLVEKYTFHRDAYLRGKGGDYNETQLRQDFIDPFFHALGWDVNNNKGFSEAYREVLLEEPIRIRGTTYFFDYTFRIGGVRKFIVETKKPSVRIKDDAESALQLRRYAWNAKLPLSILTNFEEFAIYDCTIKPEHNDPAAKGRIEYFTYNEIPAKWDYLVSVFSQDSILKGSFDKYAESTKGKKGTATVDDDILTEIESWRDALAKNIALRNTSLSVDELNTVVQRTIDRIIFLRICEDRGVEEYTTLHKLLEGDHVYTRLCDLFRLADAKYNSGIFHFENEPDWNELPDTLSLTLTIDDKVLKGIIKRLYYPETPYLFSVIPPAILGHVYEQFLGKVIRLTESHQAKVEYKPEVKKAGGVFYTPQYIVEYIVAHTVGELVKDKAPREVAKLRILDPACGSGSFLIGAYQFLLNWHRDWYIEHLVPVFIDKKSVTDPAVLALLPEPTPRGKKKLAQVDLPIFKAGTSGDATRTRSDWRLTTAEKKRILLNNLYGVDIDQQAVEVTKLSLLLKVLEEENEENIDKQLKLFAERALPSLNDNIKCGNSLIGWDIMTPEMPAEEIKRINPFDWDTEFADIMKAGGFDAVIGNPPYLFITMLDELQKDYFAKHSSTFSYRFDIYGLFIEDSIKKFLNNKGILGFIIPHTLLNNDSFEKLRIYLIQKVRIISIIDLGAGVFDTAKNETMLIFIENDQPNEKFETIILKSDNRLSNENAGICVNQNNFQNLPKCAFLIDLSDFSFKFLYRLKQITANLGNFCTINQGLRTGDNEKYISDNKTLDSHKPVVAGKDIARYLIKDHQYVQYEPKKLDAPRREEIFTSKEKIIVQEVRNISLKRRIIATYDDKQFFALQTTNVLNIRENVKSDLKLKYLLGILNSSLINWFFLKSFPSNNHIASNQLEQIPIRTINFSDPADKARHDRMVTLVTQMLDLNKRLQDARLEQEKTLLARQIEATDAAIDKLVYELYGLTEEEIGIVEGKNTQ